ncbi:hypothetical protein NO1_1876 [Candidatus Termititenax aidoneus]|uniref:Uncharacterized protein n=1 Tax=Termititenax aidoneus TaxID=2218524 RepID=A0A388TDH6_TERA1|nr:hypothetical protein NO1_1876 [Candidatus Termititenax aidoneus]
MTAAAVLGLAAQILLVVLLFITVLVAWQLFRILRDVAQISRRIEVLTDVAGWLGFFRKISKK